MYRKFFGLDKLPFNMTPDPAFLFLSEQHREALAGLTYAIRRRKGFLELSGVAGAGKSTLIRWVLQKVSSSELQSSIVLNPTLTPSEFIELMMLDFGIQDVPASKAQRLCVLQDFLLKKRSEGGTSVVIIDEAHKLSSEVLEEIRLLGNFEGEDEKLLQIVLVGQSELDEVLARAELWQLKQRISVRLSLQPLKVDEVQDYIEHRWRVAGGTDPTPFCSDAITHIARWSKGIPRLINSICDNALLGAFAESTRLVSAGHVYEAASDLLLLDTPARPIATREGSAPATKAVNGHAPAKTAAAAIPYAPERKPAIPAGAREGSAAAAPSPKKRWSSLKPRWPVIKIHLSKT